MSAAPMDLLSFASYNFDKRAPMYALQLVVMTDADKWWLV